MSKYLGMLGVGNRLTVDISLDEESNRLYNRAHDGSKVPIYYDMERVGGEVTIKPIREGKRIEHAGITIEFVGRIDILTDRRQSSDFTTIERVLEMPGEMAQEKTFKFEFTNCEKLHESYKGIAVNLRYFLRVTVKRRVTNFVQEKDLWVHTFHNIGEINNSIKMEVGIEDNLHIEFEYSKSKYHLKDVIVGKIYFLLVRIKIKHMELKLIKKEIVNGQPPESKTITTFEIMDGAPVRGESIPIRFFLGGHDLQPTLRDINKKFSVKYWINLVLVDEGERRYFKQQEITLWRSKEATKADNMGAYSGARDKN